jgi:predicted nucleic acid-binding protein
MILVDTNVIVGLIDDRDRLHTRARRDLRKLKGPFGTTGVVLSEVCFLLVQDHLRARLRLMLEQLPIAIVESQQSSWSEVFEWLARHADHEPDLCDAMLAVLATQTASRIWSYDGEFRKVWRGSDGKALRVLPATRGA